MEHLALNFNNFWGNALGLGPTGLSVWATAASESDPPPQTHTMKSLLRLRLYRLYCNKVRCHGIVN